MKTGTVLLFFFLTPLFWAQSKKEEVAYQSVTHTVVPNETVLSISKLYKINPDVVYRNNRFALDSIKEGMVLTFPTPIITASSTDQAVVLQNEPLKEKEPSVSELEVKEVTPAASTSNEKLHKSQSGKTIQHLVQPKETLYGLSKKYGVSITAIQNQNQTVLKNGLQANQTLLITIN